MRVARRSRAARIVVPRAPAQPGPDSGSASEALRCGGGAGALLLGSASVPPRRLSAAQPARFLARTGPRGRSGQ
jgi:hypothetical protein